MAEGFSDISAIEEEITCALCRNILNEPKLLPPCNHVFCRPCVESLAFRSGSSPMTVACPKCRQVAQVPGDSVANFPTAYDINRLKDIYYSMKMPTTQSTDDQHEETDGSKGDLHFKPKTRCYTSRFVLKAELTPADPEYDSKVTFDEIQGAIALALHAGGATFLGNHWTSATETWLEVTFEADKHLKKFLQSKRNLETALNEILDKHQREHSLMDSQRVSSTQLFLVTPEKLCEVTLASYRKCAKLYADSKMYEMGHETVLSKVSEDALINDDLPDLMIELAEVSAKWPILGLFLKMGQNTLDEIELENPGPGSTKRRLSSMLSKWMSRYPDEARWSTLVAALVHSELQGTAMKIADMYGVSCPEIHAERESLRQHLRDIGELMERVELNQNTLEKKQELLKKSQSEGVIRSEAIESIKGSLKAAIDKEKQLEVEKAEVERRLQKRENELQQQEDIGREVSTALEKEVSQLRQQLRTNTAQLHDATNDASRFKQALQTTSSDAMKRHSEAEQLRSEISGLERSMYMARREIKVVREQLVSHSDYRDTVAELNKLAPRHVPQQPQEDVQALLSSIQALKRENRQLRDGNHQLQLQVLVHTADNKFTLDVKPTDTIRSIKSKIESRKGIPVHRQELGCVRCQHFNSLEDDKKLQDYWPYYGELHLRSGYCTVS